MYKDVGTLCDGKPVFRNEHGFEMRYYHDGWYLHAPGSWSRTEQWIYGVASNADCPPDFKWARDKSSGRSLPTVRKQCHHFRMITCTAESQGDDALTVKCTGMSGDVLATIEADASSSIRLLRTRLGGEL